MNGKSPLALFAVLVSALTSLGALGLLLQQDRPGILRDLPITLATLACGVAVVAALGAVLIIARTSQQPEPPGPDPSPRYRAAVEMAWADEKLSEVESRRLDELEAELGLGRDRAREIELQIMGRDKEEVPPEIYPVDPAVHYRAAVEMAWADKELNEAEKKQLGELARDLRVAGGQAEEIEREIMDGTKDEIPTLSPPWDDQAWMKLVEQCVGIVDELDHHMTAFDPQLQELADHVILRLGEVLERSGVDVISDDIAFDSRRHRPEKAGSRTSPGATITETLSPGFAVGRRVLRRARVRVD
jgi:molecular chaperone GrpE (heat shock protein)